MRFAAALLISMLSMNALHAENEIIMFGAPWCEHCEGMAKHVLSAQRHGYNIVAANIDEKRYNDLPGRFSHDEIPFFVVYDKRTKKVIKVSPPGSMAPDKFKTFIKQYLKPKEKP